MKKVFTKVLMAAVLLLSFATMTNAQTTIWPIATDSATIKASQFSDTSQIFWSRTGNLTPPTGFKGWTTRGISSIDPAKKDSARWIWRRDASASGGAYWGTLRAIGSPTASNGAAVMNSDFLDNKGSSAAADEGTGQAPAPQESELISPIFDATGKTDLVVQFHQYFRRFSNTATHLQYSSDGGTTWSARITFNPESEVAVNQGTLNPVIATNTDSTLKRVVLKGSVGTSQMRIKFVFESNYYFWIIDDVKILDWKYYDMKMSNFYAIPPSLYTQKEQLEPYRFLADVTNSGITDMKNVKLIVTVWRSADGAVMFRDTTKDYPTTFKADTTYENRALPKTFNMSTLNPGMYFGSYRVVGDSSSRDITPANDTARFAFVVSDFSTALSVSVAGVGQHNFTKENGSVSVTRVADSYWSATEPKSWRIGNYYRFNNSKNKTVTTLLARLNANAAAGRSIGATLYEWKDANTDGVVQATERTLVAIADTAVPSTQSTTTAWFLFKLKDLTTNGVFRPKDSTDYLAMVEFDAPAPAATPLYLTAGFTSGVYDYSAMKFVTDSFLQKPRYTMVMGKTIDSDWSTAGFTNQTLTPVVRLNVLPFVVNTNDILSDANKMEVFPNPTGADFININVDLTKQVDGAIRVMSVEGRLMAEQVIENLDNKNIRLDISTYPAGTYVAQILTADGIMSRRFVVTK